MNHLLWSCFLLPVTLLSVYSYIYQRSSFIYRSYYGNYKYIINHNYVISKKLSELEYEDLFQDDDDNDRDDSNDDVFNIEDVIKIIKDEKEQNNRNMKLKEEQVRRDTMKRRKDREYESYWKRNEVAVKNDLQRMSTQAMYKAYYSLDVNETLSSKLQSIDDNNNNNDVDYSTSRVGKSIRKSSSSNSIKSSKITGGGGGDVNKVFHTSRGTSIGTSGSIRKWQDNINDKTSINPIKTKNILSVANVADVIADVIDDDQNDEDNTQSRFQVMINRESQVITESSPTNSGILSVTSKHFMQCNHYNLLHDAVIHHIFNHDTYIYFISILFSCSYYPCLF